jgi:hypothetical protein
MQKVTLCLLGTCALWKEVKKFLDDQRKSKLLKGKPETA